MSVSLKEYSDLQKKVIEILLKTVEIKDDTIRMLRKRGD